MANNEQPRATARPHGGMRILRWLMNGRAAGVLLMATGQALAGTVVTDNVFSLTTQAQANVPLTFGQVFKEGDVPAGSSVTATLGGQPVTLQVDPKATNPDGSLRHAVLTLIAPQLPMTQQTGVPLVLSTGSASAGAAVGLSQVLATGYAAQASFNFGGVIYSVNARPLLQAAANAGACAAWNPQCNLWLSGPLVSEWVVNGPAVSSGGANAPGLRVYFAVRAYRGAAAGSIGQVRTDIIVENSNAFAPQVQPQYTATLTSGSASYTSPALTQYAYTRWHHVLWWNNAEPHVYLQQNTQYIQDTKAVSRYMPLTPGANFLAGLRQTCAPLDHCDQTPDMGNTGAQPAIGPLPRWTSVYIVDPDVRAYNWMLANTDALGAYGIHYRDAATGYPVSIQKHPYVTLANWNYAQQKAAHGDADYQRDLLQSCTDNAVVSGCNQAWFVTGNPYRWQNAHQPDEGYVPYMVTGSYYYMSELAFGASNNELYVNEAYRGYAQGLVDPSHGEVRGKAWSLREMVNAAWLLPDNYPLKAEFNADVNNSLANWNQNYTNNSHANPLGVLADGLAYSMNGGSDNGMAPWQHDFLTWSVGHAAELGFAGAAQFRNWLAKFEIGLMTDSQTTPNGFCWLEASTYELQVQDASKQWLPSYAAVYATTFPTLTALACNTAPMVAVMAKLPGNPNPGQVGEMYGYAYSPTGYPANLQIGLATAADSGLPNAQLAWSIFESRSVEPTGTYTYADYPNFAVIPRTVTAGAVPPPTMPDPSDPVAPPPSPPTTPPPTAPPSGTPPSSTPGLSSSGWSIAFNPVVALMPRCAVGPACGVGAQPSVATMRIASPPATSTQRAVATQDNASNARPASPAVTPRVVADRTADTGIVESVINAVCNRFTVWCVRALPAQWYMPTGAPVVRPAAVKPAPVRASVSTVMGQVAPAIASRRAVSAAGVIDRDDVAPSSHGCEGRLTFDTPTSPVACRTLATPRGIGAQIR